jgi:hypothetical protein
MTKSLRTLGIAILLSFSMTSLLWAEDDATDDQQTQDVSQAIDNEAEMSQGREQVTTRLKQQFNVSDETISDLRNNKKMGYGEISIALSMAQQLEGGATPENVQKVIALRQGDKKTGWGNVAKQLNLKMGDVVSSSHKVHSQASSDNNAVAGEASSNTTDNISSGAGTASRGKTHSSNGSKMTKSSKPPKSKGK